MWSSSDVVLRKHFKSFYEIDISPSIILNNSSDFNNYEFANTTEAVCFMSTFYNKPVFNFAKSLYLSRNKSISVFLLVDAVDPNEVVQTEEGIYLISLDASTTRKSGFRLVDNSKHNLNKEVTSWDKVLFFFSTVLSTYEFVWLIEYDVLIPTITAFNVVDTFARSRKADLVVASNIANLDGHIYDSTILPSTTDKRLKLRHRDWHWHSIHGKMPIPWYRSYRNVKSTTCQS
jgi:hypothetical protein